MRIIVGLGNPGEKYKNNRHNVGHMVVDEISKSPKLQNSKQIKIFKSDTFMNNSGSFVKKLLYQYPSIPVSSIYVVHDDLDLRLGTWKIQLGKGPKDHGGINDIEHKLGSDNFWRVRVGIDPTTPRLRGAPHGKDYVLADFTKEEKIILDKVVDEICKKLTRDL